MARLAVIILCGAGVLIWFAAIAAPLAGIAEAAGTGPRIDTHTVAVPPATTLLVRSLTLSAVAVITALLLGAAPAALLGAGPTRYRSTALGLILAPLLIPPQVYAYAWQLATTGDGLLAWIPWTDLLSRCAGGAVMAGLISGAWLWPVTALILAAGWRSHGHTAFTLALLDAAPARAWTRAALPTLRGHVLAAGALVGIVTLIEYAIPHLGLCRVWATELIVLVDVGAPPGQVLAMASHVTAVVLIVLILVGLGVRATRSWSAIGDNPIDMATPTTRRSPAARRSPATLALAAAVWAATVLVPAIAMLSALREGLAWSDGFALLAREWGISLEVSLATALLAVTPSVTTVLLTRLPGWRRLRATAWPVLLIATVPPAALGVGFITIFNRPGFVETIYTRSPWVWIFALTARYAAVAVLIPWLVLGQRGIVAVDQARADGADAPAVLAHVLLPMAAPALAAAGVIVMILSMGEVVVTQLVGPPGWPSIAMTILGHMHYGRDDVVITTSLVIVVVGVVLTQLCSRLLIARTR